jgi:hypothetical protein
MIYKTVSEVNIQALSGPDALLFDTFRVFFVSSQGFSKSGNPDVLKLFHRHSVWMIRISVLVKVNGILVKVNGIRHYYFKEQSIRSNHNYSAILAAQ